MREIVRLSLVLFVIAAISALLLGATNYVTRDIIAEQIRVQNEQARIEVLGEADAFEQMDPAQLRSLVENLGFENPEIMEEVYIGKKSGEIIGYTFKSLPKGYGGNITVLTGIALDGTVTGMRVVSHSETPGLGAKSTEPAFMDQFQGLSAGEPVSVIKSGTSQGNEVNAITGSTITSQGVTDGVNASIEVFGELNK
ncbi:RnfABCDGE type electron transport complex subunit G [Alkalibacter rhizosphaerae]|uniref:Ion-translocating oxidoreductase complex subunit G n=1 Tax=Alkalibacter rhizosphaerae TaxID=2815577 RepID=A0A974XFW5_9FIRM|nr:RnfABCDGE type electron transport complex subunit G [Alkalibacter rhizosphaerae]QSX07980.1 RnfABCDGE type electron transport complex subunit G [Alkalibacter rhizosphaerae]